MLIAVRQHGVELSAAGRAYAIDRVAHALAAVSDHVRKVMVFVSDQNGPRGGDDKRCRLAVTLAAGRPVVVEATGQTVCGVVDGAADAARRVVPAEVRRRSDRRRSGRLVQALKQLKLAFGRNGGMP